ncbi:MAG: formate dehydrogenase accessory sulfurtransferase FdhD [Deltaproteobacteria bacterium]|nr:formate dehydrogenase accessory sulfurtransferase FdhD [Deltaproteobacteria bacterium]
MAEEISRRFRTISYPGAMAENWPVVREVPVTIYINGQDIATLLCLGNHLEALAVGFLASEGFIHHRDDLMSISVNAEQGEVFVEAKTKIELIRKLSNRRVITSGCGTGTSFYHVLDALSVRRVEGEAVVSLSIIQELMQKLTSRSTLYQATRGVHNVALCTAEELIVFHEDIGRHNAVDKIHGECLLKGIFLSDKILLTTGRISSEILIKTGKMSVPIVVSRSAPTSLSLSLAEEIGITVIGFARGRRMRVFTGERRVREDAPRPSIEPSSSKSPD